MGSLFKQRLAAGQQTMVCSAGRVLHHNLIQILGLQGGFHGLWFDMEHVGISTELLEVATMAARSQGMDSFCRVAPTDYAVVTRCFEAGASGVMAAQIHTAAQAEEFVRWSKFAPRGHRGMNSGGWDGRFSGLPLAEFAETANRDNFVAIQIETPGAVEECDAIAAIDGVDLLFVGPADLSQTLGVTGDFWNEKCLTAIDRVAAACRRHGKQWGAVTVSPEHADMLVEKGCLMLSPASDAKIVAAGIAAIKQAFGRQFSA